LFGIHFVKQIEKGGIMKTFQFKSIIVISLLLFIMVSLMSLSNSKTPWVIDAKYKAMKNPVKADAASIEAGKVLWNKNCASCHGKTGLGDGVKARTLDESTGDFSKAEFQNLPDGEIFGKTKLGREEMPKYDGKIADEDIWNIVNFTRTLKK
jgi:mono/diheme cytochrome c family protein